MTASDRLRDATAAAHAAVEHGFDWRARMADRDGYRQVLASLHGFHAAWEPRAAAALADPAFFDPRRRLHLLSDDLRRLGMTEPVLARRPATPVPPMPDRAAALGSLYVVEGSTLGGRAIARHVAASLGLGPGDGLDYHLGHGTLSGPLWRALRQRLDHALRTPAELDAAVAAALATFACLGRCLTAPVPVPA